MTDRPPQRRRLRTVLSVAAASALVVGACVGGLSPAAIAATTPTPAPSTSTAATTTSARTPLQQLLDRIAAALKPKAATPTPTASASASATPKLTTSTPVATAAPAATATPTPTAAAVANKPVVVSLTFDDGDDDQVAAANTLTANGLKGTFYINSGFLGAAGYMTQAQVKALYTAGHEVGGHTVNHPDLPSISAAEAKRQICLDRVNLTDIIGANAVTSFAYPFASENASVESIVNSCGYNSARGLGDLRSPYSCAGCSPTETIPPAKPFITAAPDEVESNWTLADLQSLVTNAQATGGWVQYTFHHICPSGQTCAQPTMSSALYTQFVQWLKTKVATAGSNVTVKTVAQVINKAPRALVQPAYPAAAAAGVNAIKNPSLETFDSLYNNPTCFQQGGYGSNTAAFSWAGTPHTGTKAETLTVSNYSDGDAKLLPILDLGECAPTVTPGKTYSLREWYTSTTATQYAVYLRDATGRWTYWTSSPWFAASSTYALASWTTPAIPTGSTGISFGMNLFSNGTLVTDDWAMYESSAAPAIATAAKSTIEVVPNTTSLVPANAEKKGTVQVPDETIVGGEQQ